LLKGRKVDHFVLMYLLKKLRFNLGQRAYNCQAVARCQTSYST